MKYKGTAIIIYDGQAGSCGKGKFVGQLAIQEKIDITINNNMPNAGHTFVYDDGRRVVTTHLPMAVVSPTVKYLIIGAGAAINAELLYKELDDYADIINGRKIYIHKRAAIVLAKHIDNDRKIIRSGSTFKGSASAYAEKVMRVPGVKLARDYNWDNRVELVEDDFFQDILTASNGFTGNEKILIENSQGFDLDINHGLEYPHVTFRQCSPAQALADCGLPHNIKTKTYMIIRPYPIRVNNQSVEGEIYTGDYIGSKEITWAEIEKRSGCIGLEKKEVTTITKKLRRVFEFNEYRFMRAIAMTNPDSVIINFAQYIDADVIKSNSCNEITEKLEDFVNKIVTKFDVKISYLGTGEKFSDFIEI